MATPDLSRAAWRKSSCSTGDAECVEVAVVDDVVAVRDSKDSAGPALIFTPDAWTDFLNAAKTGAFDCR